MVQTDLGLHLTPDYFLHKQVVPDTVLEIVVVDALRPDFLFQRLEIGELILLPDAVELLHHVRFHSNAEVFRSLHKERLINQVAKSIFSDLFRLGPKLILCATLAFVLCFLGRIGQRFLIINGGDDVVVHPRNDIFHYGALNRRGRRGLCGFRGCLAGRSIFRGGLHGWRAGSLRLRRVLSLSGSARTHHDHAQHHPTDFHRGSPKSLHCISTFVVVAICS